MSEYSLRLIWLFPIVFIIHDFEELVLFEPWLKKNTNTIKALIRHRIPSIVEKQINNILDKTSSQFTLPIFLVFLLTVISTVLLVVFDSRVLFMLASSSYFLHGFMHIGQSIIMRKYIPALFTSICIVLPYGILLFSNLLAAHIIDINELLIYFIISIISVIPFILIMHYLGESIYKVLIKVAI